MNLFVCNVNLVENGGQNRENVNVRKGKGRRE
jgi:hypothetical protein